MGNEIEVLILDLMKKIRKLEEELLRLRSCCHSGGRSDGKAGDGSKVININARKGVGKTKY